MEKLTDQCEAAVEVDRPNVPEEPATENIGGASYRQILSSSALIGGSSAFNVGIGIVRTKVMAVILEPGGFGLMGIYVSLVTMVGTLTTLGMDSSAVRQIAEAAGSGDRRRIARTITTLRRMMLISGCIGTLLLFIFRKTASIITFGDTQHASVIGLLSLTVLFASVSVGQRALIQGLRHLKELAYINIFGALFGTLVSIPLVMCWGKRGVAPSLLAISAFGILPSWWFARRISVAQLRIEWREAFMEARAMLKLGLAFLASGLLGAFASFVTRIILIHHLGLHFVGTYQAVVMISGTYVGFITQAIVADFYPRLTAVARNNVECNRLVNEQIEVSLLIATPGILATIALAPLVINMFYSSQFLDAMVILRWQCVGMLLRLVSAPLKLILLAKNRGQSFVITEIITTVVNVILFWFSVRFLGFVGAGIAFFLLYVFYLCLMALMARRLSDFRWSAANRRYGVWASIAVAVTFVCCQSLPTLWGAVLGTSIAFLAVVWSISNLANALQTRFLTFILAKAPILASISNKIFGKLGSKRPQ